MYDQETQQRFWNKVNKTDTCWLWTGYTDSHGYGALKFQKGKFLARRVSYELANGPIPERYFVRHNCDTRLCVNPDHLYISNNTRKGSHSSTGKGRPAYNAGFRLIKTPTDGIKIFWDSVAKTDACWIWTGHLDKQGYGVVPICSEHQELLSISSRSTSAHRFSYLLAFGAIPKGLVVRHKCDNPQCVRPDHLLIGTHADNIADMDARNRRYSKITKGQAQELRDIWEARPNKHGLRKELAKRFDISPRHVWHIVNYKSWGLT